VVRQFEGESAQSGCGCSGAWGEQTYDEMMVGFFDVGVPAGVDKQHFFIRKEER